MTKQEKKLWLEAIEKLREHYEEYGLIDGVDEIPPSYECVKFDPCPLCGVAQSFASRGECFDCLWVIFEGGECENLNYSDDIIKQRLTRLNRWEGLLKDSK